MDVQGDTLNEEGDYSSKPMNTQGDTMGVEGDSFDEAADPIVVEGNSVSKPMDKEGNAFNKEPSDVEGESMDFDRESMAMEENILNIEPMSGEPIHAEGCDLGHKPTGVEGESTDVEADGYDLSKVIEIIPHTGPCPISWDSDSDDDIDSPNNTDNVLHENLPYTETNIAGQVLSDTDTQDNTDTVPHFNPPSVVPDGTGVNPLPAVTNNASHLDCDIDEQCDKDTVDAQNITDSVSNNDITRVNEDRNSPTETDPASDVDIYQGHKAFVDIQPRIESNSTNPEIIKYRLTSYPDSSRMKYSVYQNYDDPSRVINVLRPVDPKVIPCLVPAVRFNTHQTSIGTAVVDNQKIYAVHNSSQNNPPRFFSVVRPGDGKVMQITLTNSDVSKTKQGM